jgi:outer membrane lipoprotein-sorting protein
MTKNAVNNAAIGICAAMLMLGLSACQKKGPAEQAGEKLDQAAESVKDAGAKAEDKVEAAADKVQEAVK